jgi:hypothetical protein
MKTSTVETLIPAITVLAEAITRIGDHYQQLLHQQQAYPFCREAGRSLRCLSDRYAQVLLAAFEYMPDTFSEEDDDVDGEKDSLSDVESESDK